MVITTKQIRFMLDVLARGGWVNSAGYLPSPSGFNYYRAHHINIADYPGLTVEFKR